MTARTGRRHAWDYGGAAAYVARRKTCTVCGVTGKAFGVGAGRYWSYTDLDGVLLRGSRQPACPPAN